MFVPHSASKVYPPSPQTDVRQRKGTTRTALVGTTRAKFSVLRKLLKSGFRNEYYNFTLANTQAKRACLAFTSLAGLTVKPVYKLNIWYLWFRITPDQNPDGYTRSHPLSSHPCFSVVISTPLWAICLWASWEETSNQYWLWATNCDPGISGVYDTQRPVKRCAEIKYLNIAN